MKFLLFKNKAIFILVFCLVLLAGVSIIKAVDIFPPSTSTPIQIGVQIPDTNPLTQPGRLTKDNYNFSVIKFQYGNSAQPVKNWATTAKSLGYEVMVSFAKNHTGFTLPSEIPMSEECPGGYGEFRNYVEEKARDLGGLVNLYEVWNEPNLLVEWDESRLGPINGAKYAKLLQCGAKGVKIGNPNAKVISAGLSPNPTAQVLAGDFLNQMLTSGVDLSQVDYYGVHLYSNQNLDPSDGNNSIHELRFYAEKDKKLYVTEFGWNRCDAQISVEQQKGYISKSFDVISSQYPQVEGMIVWNFGFTQTTNPNSDFECYNIEGETNPTSINVGAAAKLAENSEPIPYFIVRNNNGVVERRYVPKGKSVVCNSPLNRDTATDKTNLAAPSLINESEKTDVQARALNPVSVNIDIQKKADSSKQTRTGVERNFLENIAFNFGLCNLFAANFCNFNVSAGEDTEEFALRSQTISEADLPTDIKLIPEENDCSIVDIDQSKGNEDLNKYSVYLGKKTGNPQLPEFSDHQKRIEECKSKENLTVPGGQFTGDERACDIDIAGDEATKAQFPEGVNPFPESNHGYLEQ